MGRTEFLTWKRLRGEPWLAEQKQKQKLQRERNGARRSARISAPQKYLTPPTLLETPGYRNYLRPTATGLLVHGVDFPDRDAPPHETEVVAKEVIEVVVLLASTATPPTGMILP